MSRTSLAYLISSSITRCRRTNTWPSALFPSGPNILHSYPDGRRTDQFLCILSPRTETCALHICADGMESVRDDEDEWNVFKVCQIDANLQTNNRAYRNPPDRSARTHTKTQARTAAYIVLISFISYISPKICCCYFHSFDFFGVAFRSLCSRCAN